MNTNNPSPKLDISQHRLEESWNDNSEQMLYEWSNQCAEKSSAHDKAGRKNKRYFAMVNLPVMLTSVTMSGLAGFVGDMPYWSYVNVAGLVGIGCMNAIGSFYNFGQKEQKHFDTATRYHEISIDVAAELNKGREFRIPSDVFVTQVRMRIAHLDRIAPVI